MMTVRALAIGRFTLLLALATTALSAQTKEVPTRSPESRVAPVVCSGNLINTSFTCGAGLGPFMTPQGAINDPDQYVYLLGTCTPGDTVRIDAYRTSSHADPAIHACEGNLCGAADNVGWGPFACPPGSALLAAADDDLSPDPCGFGGFFADPSMTFVCPASGVFTLAAYDFVGHGEEPEFEIHTHGVIEGVPTLGAMGLVVLALLLLSGGWLLLARRRSAIRQ